jgi:hypothetical protein
MESEATVETLESDGSHRLLTSSSFSKARKPAYLSL